MELKKLGALGSGQVVFDRPQSHLHEGVLEILSEALSRIHLSGEQFTLQQVDFEGVVGETTCVVTYGDDQIVFAKRPRRGGLTRFVKGREPEPCSSICVILKRAEDRPRTYVLITAFIGVCPQPEPWDRNATAKSVKFWNSHALVWGSEVITPGTGTSVCPW